MIKNAMNMRGVTLIALIITIIVLLILAGISIASLTGENGILNKSKTAKEETKKADYQETLQLIKLELTPDKTLENWNTEQYMEFYEYEIRNNEIFTDAKEIKKIFNDEELIIQIITKEEWVYRITESNIEYLGLKSQVLPSIYVALVGNTLCFFDNEEDAKNSVTDTEYFYGYIGESDYFRDSNSNDITTPWFKHKDLITQVDFIDKIEPRNMMCYFGGLSSLTTINHIENLKTHQTTNMQDLFYKCSSLSELDLSFFDTTNITDMRCMFYDCKNINNLDLSSFNTSNVVDMSYMFYHCNKLNNINLQNWDTRNVRNMTEMFDACGFITLDLSHFDTRNVKEMIGMFAWCMELKELNCQNFVVSPSTDISLFLINITDLQKLDIRNMDLSNHTANKEVAFSGLDNTEILVNQNMKNWLIANYPNLQKVVVVE